MPLGSPARSGSRQPMNFRVLSPDYFDFLPEIPIFVPPIQPGRTAGAEAEGGAVAQSVEQRTENPCVGGSIPPHTTEQTRVWCEKLQTLFLLVQHRYNKQII